MRNFFSIFLILAAVIATLLFHSTTRSYAQTDVRIGNDAKVGLNTGKNNNFSAALDLHAHLFMDEGMSWFFDGGFFSPLKADHWKDRRASRANDEALIQSGLKVVVVALYAHPMMTLSVRGSIHNQIDQAEQFVSEHPEWVIVKSPYEAENALAAGKRVLILSLETAAGVLENETDLLSFIDHRGIRIVTFMHLTADDYGGVAFQKGIGLLASPWDGLKSLFSPKRSQEGVRVNPTGLTQKGAEMIQALIKRKVWIDLAHSSDATQDDLIPLLKKAGQPLLYTHTVLRRYFPYERAISDEQLKQVKDTRGLIGLMPSEDMMEPIVKLQKPCPPCPDRTCRTGVKALAEHFRAASDVLGRNSVGLGSDTNAPIIQISPSCGTGTSIDQKGFVNYAQIGDLWHSLRESGAPLPDPTLPHVRDPIVSQFLATWKKVYEPH